MSNAYGKSPKGSTPTSSSNGYQPAQQKFTSGIAQPSRSSSGLSAALAGSPSWMTPPAAHTPFQLPANLPGIMNPPAVQRPQMMPGSPQVQSPNPQSGIMGLSHLTGMGGTGPAGISSVMRAPGPAPTPVYQGPGTAQWNPATQTWNRTDQGPAGMPGQHPAIQNPGLTGSNLYGSKPVNIAQTMAPTPKPAPQPINQIAQPPQQGTMNPPPPAPAPGGGMTALAPGNLPPPAQPGPGQAFNPGQQPGVQNVLSQHPGWTYHGNDITPSWGAAEYQDAQGNGFNADGTPYQNPMFGAPNPTTPFQGAPNPTTPGQQTGPIIGPGGPFQPGPITGPIIGQPWSPGFGPLPIGFNPFLQAQPAAGGGGTPGQQSNPTGVPGAGLSYNPTGSSGAGFYSPNGSYYGQITPHTALIPLNENTQPQGLAGMPMDQGPGPAPGPNMTFVPSGLQTPSSHIGSWVPNSQAAPGSNGAAFATLF
jgi:hypothetical protein